MTKMYAPMSRYVLLEHDHPQPHFDLMLEAGDGLRTWRLPVVPGVGDALTAVRISDHRLAYLDYEGPVSGNRGSVRRRDAGVFEWVEDTAALVVVRITSGRLSGVLRLKRTNSEEWVLQIGPA